MMFPDEETETQHKRLPDDSPAVPAVPAVPADPAELATSGESDVPEYLEGVIQPVRRERPLIRPGTMKPQSGARPLQISNGTRRVPSYPAWEKPPSAFEYPRLRGQEIHRPVKPLLIATVGVALIAAIVLAFSALTGHGGGVAAASGSARPTASLSGSPIHGPSGSATRGPSPSASATVTRGTPGPQISFQQYQVLAGESATSIARKFKIKTWEFLAANPQLTPPNYSVKVKAWVNIPLPGQMTLPTPTPSPSPSAS
jgi:LysM repeat protein